MCQPGKHFVHKPKGLGNIVLLKYFIKFHLIYPTIIIQFMPCSNVKLECKVLMLVHARSKTCAAEGCK